MSNYPTVEEREAYLRTQERDFCKDSHIDNAKKVLAFLDELGLKGGSAQLPLFAAILMAYPFDLYPNVFIIISQVRAAYLKMRMDMNVPMRSAETSLWRADNEADTKELGERIDKQRAVFNVRYAATKNRKAFGSQVRNIHIVRLPQIA